MFLKLAREHPTLKRYWTELTSKGSIRNSEGAITFKGDMLIVKDTVNSVRFTLRRDGMVVVRGYDKRCPTMYKYLLSDMPLLDLDNPYESFEVYEGLECALRDLKRAIREIIKKHRKSKGLFFRTIEWLDVSSNGYFTMFVALYALITLVLIANQFLR